MKLVQLLRQLLAADTLVVTLHGGGQLALALCSRLLVELACAQFGQQTGFCDSALEATHSDFERLVFFKADSGHVKMKPLDLGKNEIITDFQDRWKVFSACAGIATTSTITRCCCLPRHPKPRPTGSYNRPASPSRRPSRR